jgi:hypothetical protein
MPLSSQWKKSFGYKITQSFFLGFKNYTGGILAVFEHAENTSQNTSHNLSNKFINLSKIYQKYLKLSKLYITTGYSVWYKFVPVLTGIAVFWQYFGNLDKRKYLF